MSMMSNRVLTDAFGRHWRPSADYQEHDTTARGWLELSSDDGRVENFSVVLMRYGFEDQRGKYLRVEYDHAEDAAPRLGHAAPPETDTPQGE